MWEVKPQENKEKRKNTNYIYKGMFDLVISEAMKFQGFRVWVREWVPKLVRGGHWKWNEVKAFEECKKIH